MSSYKKILLIAIDTLNVDHLGCYGYNIPRLKTTPFIDSLAEEGAIFRKHYSTDVPTPPCYTSLFTGVRGIKNGIIGFYNEPKEFFPPASLLCECFSQKGFRVGMISNLLYVCPWLVKGVHDIYPPGLRFQGGSAEEVTDEATHWLNIHYKKDFFLFVHYWDPHVPYLKRSKEKYRKMFSPEEYKDSIPDMKYFEENKFLKIIYEEKHKAIDDPLPPEENLALYDANIRYVDDNIERLINNLEKMGIRDETIVCVTSDHGEAFGEYGFFDHWSCYRNISQLPLIFSAPDIKSIEIDAYVQDIDIMPTLLELSGVNIPENIDGMSMRPLLENKQKYFREEVVVNSDATAIQRMYIKDDFALVHTLSRSVWDHVNEYELFNLKDDPDQVNNISPQEKEKEKEMRVALQDWLAKELNGAPDPLWLSVYRGGWMWRELSRYFTGKDREELFKRYPEMGRILNFGASKSVCLPVNPR